MAPFATANGGTAREDTDYADPTDRRNGWRFALSDPSCLCNDLGTHWLTEAVPLLKVLV